MFLEVLIACHLRWTKRIYYINEVRKEVRICGSIHGLDGPDGRAGDSLFTDLDFLSAVGTAGDVAEDFGGKQMLIV